MTVPATCTGSGWLISTISGPVPTEVTCPDCGHVVHVRTDSRLQRHPARLARPFKVGDRVYVTDPALADLRRIMAKYGEEAKPNHHGTVDEIDGDHLFINFDDGGCAPYPVAECRHLPEAGS